MKSLLKVLVFVSVVNPLVSFAQTPGKIGLCQVVEGQKLKVIPGGIEKSSWNGVGNGGDYIRANFLSAGEASIKFLKESPVGQSLVLTHGLDIELIQKQNSIETVVVSELPLLDNTGSDVDAIGVPGQVVLNKKAWYSHFESQRDIYFLVLHELLRSAGINDDNYVISGKLRPFPESLKIRTSVVPLEPLIASDSLEGTLQIQNAIFTKDCTPSGPFSSFAEIDSLRNDLKLIVKNFKVSSSGALQRKMCAIAVPFSLKANEKLVISEVSAEGSVSLGAGGKDSFSAEAFFAGNKGPLAQKSLLGPLKGAWLAKSQIVQMTKCGEQGILRVNSSLAGTSSVANSIKISLAKVTCK